MIFGDLPLAVKKIEISSNGPLRVALASPVAMFPRAQPVGSNDRPRRSFWVCLMPALVQPGARRLHLKRYLTTGFSATFVPFMGRLSSHCQSRPRSYHRGKVQDGHEKAALINYFASMRGACIVYLLACSHRSHRCCVSYQLFTFPYHTLCHAALCRIQPPFSAYRWDVLISEASASAQ